MIAVGVKIFPNFAKSKAAEHHVERGKQPNFKTSRPFGDALESDRFWSAAVLCRFGFFSDLTGSFSRARGEVIQTSSFKIQPPAKSQFSKSSPNR